MNEYEDTDDPSDGQTGPSATPRRLTRSRDDRFIGGVAAGLADYFNIDPTLVRVAFAVSLAIGGAGVLAYLVLLALVPVEGDPDQPAPPVTGSRRNIAIGGTVLVGILLLLATASGGSGTSWLFGFGPGVLFGIFLWLLVAVGLFWAAGKAGRLGGDSPSGAPPAPGSPPAPEARTSFAPAPTQRPPAAAAAVTAADDERDETGVLERDTAETEVLADSPEDGPTGPAGPGATATSRSSAPSTFGKVMTWLAIAFTGIVLLSILAVLSFGVTALFGAIPAAVLVIGCGIGVVALALSDRPQLALWTAAAAVAIALPMALVSIASLEIEGDWGELNENPVAAFEIPDDGYQMAAGALKLDLRDFQFRKGETVKVKTDSGFGATGVIVPDDVCVVGNVEGRVGHMEILGSRSSGLDIDRDLGGPRPGVPVLELDSEFKIGYFGVFDDTGWTGDGGDWPEDLQNTDREAAIERAREACSPSTDAAANRKTGKGAANKQ